MHNDFTADIVTIYCLCDDFLRACGHQDDPQVQMSAQVQMSTAEVMTVALVAAARFGGHQENSRLFLKQHGDIKTMLSKSRLNRRLHAVPEGLWQQMLWLLKQAAHSLNITEAEDLSKRPFIVDSCPVPVCHNICICRCRLYPLRTWNEQHRGYCASKRCYYYGLKVHLLVTACGQPVEFVLTPASEADITGLRRLPLDLPEGAQIVADAAYTDYDLEDHLRAEARIELTADRRKNSRRPHPVWLSYWCQQSRRRIETTFSTLTEWMGRRLHAVTARGFELKVGLTILAYAILA